ncbi:MAG: hypothetical protein ACOZBZ_02785 [Patescibacteria group bacterium]
MGSTSEKLKRLWQDPEYRAKIGKAHEVKGDIDRQLWRYAIDEGLLSQIVKTGMVTKEEIESLRIFFEGKGPKVELEDILDRFSIAIARLA